MPVDEGNNNVVHEEESNNPYSDPNNIANNSIKGTVEKKGGYDNNITNLPIILCKDTTECLKLGLRTFNLKYSHTMISPAGCKLHS